MTIYRNTTLPTVSYNQSSASSSTDPFLTYFSTLDPSTSNLHFPVQKRWVNTTTLNEFILVGFTTVAGVKQAVWMNLTSGSNDISTITVSPGMVVSPVDNNVNFVAGNGINLSGSGDTVTFSANNAGFQWNVSVVGTTLVDNNGYFTNSAGLLSMALPTTSSVGDTYEICAMGTGGWIVSQSAGQSIRVGKQVTTTGVGGSVASVNQGDWIHIVCNVANTGFVACVLQGNLTIV